MDELSPIDPDPPRHRGIAVALLRGVLVVVGFLLAQVVAVVMLQLAGLDVEVRGRVDLPEALVLASTQLLGLVVALAPLARGIVSRGRLALASTVGAARAAGLALVPAGAVVIGPSLAAAVFGGDRVLAPGLDAARAAAFVLLACLIAVNEELWFRGHLVDQLGGARRPLIATVVSAILFGVPHFTGSAASLLNAGAVTLAVGVPFAAARLRYRTLAPLVLWHASIDAWAFLHEAAVEPQGAPGVKDVIGGMVLPTFIAAAYLVWLVRARVMPAPDSPASIGVGM